MQKIKLAFIGDYSMIIEPAIIEPAEYFIIQKMSSIQNKIIL